MHQNIRHLLILLGLLLLPGAVHAQDNTLTYGTYTTGSLTIDAPGVFYDFEGAAGDVVAIEAVALVPDLNTRVSLLTADSQSLTTSNDDPFQPGFRDGSLTYRLPANGSYSILVEAEASSTGDFLLRLENRGVLAVNALGVGATTTAELTPQQTVQVFSFNSATDSTFTATSQQSGFAFDVELRDENAESLAILSSDRVPSVSFSVAPNTGNYEVIISASAPNTLGTISIALGEATIATETVLQTDEEAPVAEESADPEAETPPDVEQPPSGVALPATSVPPEAAPTEQPAVAEGEGEPEAPPEQPATAGSGIPTDRCTVTPSSGGVVVRSGPSTDFPAIESIPAGDFRFAEGTDGDWIQVLGGGWVSSTVVDTNGPCGGLPVVSGPQPPGEEAPPPTPAGPDPIGERN